MVEDGFVSLGARMHVPIRDTELGNGQIEEGIREVDHVQPLAVRDRDHDLVDSTA